ncbi:MAG: sigma-54 interaction domain-containing protein [Acidobacteriota bacterium]
MTDSVKQHRQVLEAIRRIETVVADRQSHGPGGDAATGERLERLAGRILRMCASARQVAEAAGSGTGPPRRLVGDSPALRHILATIERIAPRRSHVLITGESGTGKELVARAIHEGSGRRGGAFVAVDCGSVSDTLLESELFGHRKGSFTGAVQDRAGLIEEASGGTLFLDELANSSAALQTRLLRVLQEGEVRRIGENHTRRVDLRVVAASSGDLAALARRRQFRQDLYYRLNVVHLAIPPLRRRREDIPPLVQHFIQGCARRYGLEDRRFTPAAMEVLLRYPWPGNIRELQNVVERSLLLSSDPTISPDRLPADLLDALLRLDEADPEDGVAVKTGEQMLIERALLQTGGDKTRAARLIGWHRTKLYRRLRSYRIPYEFGREQPAEDACEPLHPPRSNPDDLPGDASA